MSNPIFELGAAYYPDYLPPSQLTRLANGERRVLSWQERMREDFARMQRQGLNTVRMGEFSWSTVEPRPGALDFSRFQMALDLAQQHGVGVMMCTPTPTPPKWLIDEHPDLLPVTRDGRTIPFGSRRHYDFLHPVYRTESQRITREMAQALGRHPAVVAWQTDNEFGCHNSVFLFTRHARDAFRVWLKEKYGEIAALNEAWFTCFWSQGYTDFEQIELPFQSWADQNPHLELDFRRFSNDMIARFQQEQCTILHELSPGRPITHNFMTLFSDLCPWQMSRDLDVAGFDHYQMEPEPHPISSAWQFALMRSLKPGKKFLVLEQQPVQVNWQPVNRRLAFDWLFLWCTQAAFSGARGMYYFSWQRMHGGAEQYHDGVVPHDLRVPQSQQEKVLRSKRGFFDQVAQQFGLDGLPNTSPDVLCIHNSESLWTHEITSQSTLYSTRKQVDAVAQLCLSRGLGLSFAPSVAEARDLPQYQCVVLPGYAFELTDAERAALLQYVQKGGAVLTLPRTGMKQRTNQMSPLPLTLLNADDFYFEDYGALLESEVERFTDTPSTAVFTGRLWAEKIAINNPDWEVLARFQGGLYEGWPAVFRNARFPNGGCFLHVAVCPDVDDAFADWLLLQLGLTARARTPTNHGVQLFPLHLGTRSFLAAVNFGTQPSTIQLHKDVRLGKVLTARLDGKLELECSVLPNASDQLSLPGRHVALAERAW